MGDNSIIYIPSPMKNHGNRMSIGVISKYEVKGATETTPSLYPSLEILRSHVKGPNPEVWGI